MARKIILISDISGDAIPDGKGATVRINYRDQRKGLRELDVTDAEAERLGGRAVKRRGRRPRQAGGIGEPAFSLRSFAALNPDRPSVSVSYRVRMLRCEECGRCSHGRARRWQAYLTVDGEVVVYCPSSAVREFGPR